MKKFKDITGCLESTDYVKNEADALRTDLYTHDLQLLKYTGVRLSSENLKDAPDGRFVIEHKNVDFECLFKRDPSSRTLYVLFSGLRKEGMDEPTFKRWSYYKYMDGSMLNIDDPMCRIHKDLKLGWYYGNINESYCDYLSEIVIAFAEQNGYKNRNIVFFSSSGGGYAALYCACKIKSSLAVAINPQIRLSLFGYSGEFEKITNLSLSTKDKFSRNELPDLIKNASESRFLLIQNAESTGDMIQLNDLCSVLNTGFSYGISKLSDNIVSWVYQAKSDKPHNAQDYSVWFFVIEYLIKNFDYVDDLKDLYVIFNELWFEHYKLKDKINTLSRRLNSKVELL